MKNRICAYRADNTSVNNSQILSAKLTKEFLMSLERGRFLVSNICGASHRPAFAEIVSPTSSRQTQWKMILAAGAAGRLCRVFSSEGQFKSWLQAFFPPTDLN